MVYGPRVSSWPGSPSGTSAPVSSTTRISSSGEIGQALRGDDGLRVVVEPCVVDQSLGHAEDLHQLAAQRGLEAPGRLRAVLGAADEDQLQGGQVVFGGGRGLGPHQGERRHQTRHGDPLPLDERERGGRVGARAQHHRAARAQRAQPAGRAHGEVVRGGQYDEEAGVRVDPADLVGAPQRVQVVVVGARDQLGDAGGAAGELEEGQLVRRGTHAAARPRARRTARPPGRCAHPAHRPRRRAADPACAPAPGRRARGGRNRRAGPGPRTRRPRRRRRSGRSRCPGARAARTPAARRGGTGRRPPPRTRPCWAVGRRPGRRVRSRVRRTRRPAGRPARPAPGSSRCAARAPDPPAPSGRGGRRPGRAACRRTSRPASTRRRGTARRTRAARWGRRGRG